MPSTEHAHTEGKEIDLEALLSGDKEEFTRLVYRESGRLFRVIMRIIKDEDEARSVMQEAYLQAYQRLHTFRRESKFTTWLYAIGINLARASLRKSSRISSLSDDEFERLQPRFANGHHQEPHMAWDPHKIAVSAERARLVQEAIVRLPEDYRVVVTLRDIEELPTTDVARILDISEGAVRVRLHRARQAVRKLLSGHFEV